MNQENNELFGAIIDPIKVNNKNYCTFGFKYDKDDDTCTTTRNFCQQSTDCEESDPIETYIEGESHKTWSDNVYDIWYVYNKMKTDWGLTKYEKWEIENYDIDICLGKTLLGKQTWPYYTQHMAKHQ